MRGDLFGDLELLHLERHVRGAVQVVVGAEVVVGAGRLEHVDLVAARLVESGAERGVRVADLALVGQIRIRAELLFARVGVSIDSRAAPVRRFKRARDRIEQ